LFEVESTHRLGLASAEEDSRHFARARRALAFFNGLLGLIDIARKSSEPLRAAMQPATDGLHFISLSAVI
jgi:hypothetical protein